MKPDEYVVAMNTLRGKNQKEVRTYVQSVLHCPDEFLNRIGQLIKRIQQAVNNGNRVYLIDTMLLIRGQYDLYCSRKEV